MNVKKLTGKFIALDGPDGCGKTTQTKFLAQWLAEQGIDAVTFREPGGTAIGEKVRQILLHPENILMSTETETLLYMAARVQLWQEKIAPALKESKCVIIDRWLSSTCAYQGWAGGLTMAMVEEMAEDCLKIPWPDLTIIIDIDLDIAKKRMSRELDRMEQKPDEYHRKVREGFLSLAKKRSDFFVIDGRGDIESIHKEIIQTVTDFSF